MHTWLACDVDYFRKMPWDLDDLENDEEFGEMDEDTRVHLSSLGDEQDFNKTNDVCYVQPEEVASPVIFLNVDGVLHPRDSVDVLLDDQINLLKKIVDASGARIVLSSQWKSDTPSLQRLSHVFTENGLKMIGHTDDMTENIGSTTEDGGEITPEINAAMEISSWCAEHENLMDPDKWIALDCMDVDLEDEDGVQHLVKVSESSGLSEEVADKAISILKGA